MNSLIEQKARVAKLRDLYEKETNPMIKEFMKSSLACARLLHDIAEYDVLESERTEKVRARKCRTGAIVCFIVAGIAAVILAVALFGCHTFKGATSDTAWMFQKLSDNIQTQEK